MDRMVYKTTKHVYFITVLAANPFELTNSNNFCFVNN